MKHVSILGSTGSIGMQTLDVIAIHADRFAVAALAGHTNIELLQEQIKRHRPLLAAVADEYHADTLRTALGRSDTEIVWGEEGYRRVASIEDADVVVSAIVGAAGLLPTFAAVKAGKTVALANKESMVMAGSLITGAAQKSGAVIMPIDSEHSAIFQCLLGHRREDIKRIVLTASGGPLYALSKDEMEHVTVRDVLSHPRWDMGTKVTVDSATLMNKGLEVIEAHWFFNIDIARIDVLIHPQSIVHSMVEYLDGAVIAQLGIPDMRIPILYALAYPDRLSTKTPPLDLPAAGPLEFHRPDGDRFPALSLAYEVANEGGAAPAILNAANEEAVKAFLAGIITFPQICDITREVVAGSSDRAADTIDDIVRSDRNARVSARTLIQRKGHRT